jgi:hypothetical protein
VKIELLYWHECPSYPEAKALVEQALEERGIHVPIEMREVRTQEEAIAEAFPGSPTIRIDGTDVDPVGAAAPPALACRVPSSGRPSFSGPDPPATRGALS